MSHQTRQSGLPVNLSCDFYYRRLLTCSWDCWSSWGPWWLCLLAPFLWWSGGCRSRDRSKGELRGTRLVGGIRVFAGNRHTIEKHQFSHISGAFSIEAQLCKSPLTFQFRPIAPSSIKTPKFGADRHFSNLLLMARPTFFVMAPFNLLYFGAWSFTLTSVFARTFHGRWTFYC